MQSVPPGHTLLNVFEKCVHVNYLSVAEIKKSSDKSSLGRGDLFWLVGGMVSHDGEVKSARIQGSCMHCICSQEDVSNWGWGGLERWLRD